jgi:hypothetical protein
VLVVVGVQVGLLARKWVAQAIEAKHTSGSCRRQLVFFPTTLATSTSQYISLGPVQSCLR